MPVMILSKLNRAVFEREDVFKYLREIFKETKVRILSSKTPKDIKSFLRYLIDLLPTEKYKREVLVHEEWCVILDVMGEAESFEKLTAGELKPKLIWVVSPQPLHICLSPIRNIKDYPETR